MTAGSWDSIHVVEAVEASGGASATYKLTSTLMLAMDVNKAALDSNLSGCIVRQKEVTLEVTAEKPHVVNIGMMIEDMEIDMRSNMDALYVQKTREIVNSMRKVSRGPPVQGQLFTADLSAVIKARAAGGRASVSGGGDEGVPTEAAEEGEEGGLRATV